MANWSGARTGWNTRGSQATLDEKERAAELSNPNSQYYRDLANEITQQICDYLGTDDYRLWFAVNWPSGRASSWREVYAISKIALENKHFDIDCSCNGVTGPCAVCRARARIQI